MIEVHQLYERDDIVFEVVFDDGAINPIYFGIYTPDDVFEVNIDRRDIRAVYRMLGACLPPDDSGGTPFNVSL